MAINDFITPNKLTWDEKTLTADYGKVVLEPLERGYGVTVGNSLRRVLLSSIPGDAVTSVKIDGVLHEASVIPGVAEDTLDILMNLKSLVVRMVTAEPQTLYLDVEREGVVTAKEFQPNSAVEILSPDLSLATLSSGAHLKMEVHIGRGWGYVLADANKKAHQAVGTIPIDSIYSPVRRVKYEVENTRVGQITDYEKLTLEIWTNGSVTPQDALNSAAQILINHFQVFLGAGEIKPTGEEDSVSQKAVDTSISYDKNLDRSIDELELSVRAYNCLKTTNIKTVRELIIHTEEELLKHRNFGRKSLNEIREILEKMGYALGMKIIDGVPIKPEIDEDIDYEEIDRKKSRSK